MSILSLDVGDVRVGLAIMDEALRLPLPLGVVNRAQGEAERHILALCLERKVTKIVIGLPLSESGSENDQCLKVRNFARRLAQRREYCHPRAYPQHLLRAGWRRVQRELRQLRGRARCGAILCVTRSGQDGGRSGGSMAGREGARPILGCALRPS